MANAFTVMWSSEYLRWIRRSRDGGPLSVVFGGPHKRMPSLASVEPGDLLHVIAVQAGGIHLIARMRVARLDCPFCHVRSTTGLSRPPNSSWNQWFAELKRSHPEVGHRVPQTCADEAAIADAGSGFNFDNRLPAHLLPLLRLGPRPGREKPLTGLDGEVLKTHHTFHGNVRRLSVESAGIFATHAAPMSDLALPPVSAEHPKH